MNLHDENGTILERVDVTREVEMTQEEMRYANLYM